ALEVLRGWGLEDLADRSPFTLSMGQARILSILLATLWDPDLVVIDEPTSGLGWRERGMLAELLKVLDTPVVMASHDPDFILEAADRVVVLEDGRVVLDSTVPEAFYSEDLYRLGVPKPIAVLLGESVGVRVRSVRGCIG
ncbi:MAG: energy-coupling factor ABC transporter ATP-binding protein, partial [Desulfurococcales archaeon]|nr:energy-coupling factor ABC transporter ATP-binding protein [Desulfurococcales archaeon]